MARPPQKIISWMVCSNWNSQGKYDPFCVVHCSCINKREAIRERKKWVEVHPDVYLVRVTWDRIQEGT